MSVSEAREVCQYLWMKEALERLVNRLAPHKLGHVNTVAQGCIHCIGGVGKSDL